MPLLIEIGKLAREMTSRRRYPGTRLSLMFNEYKLSADAPQEEIFFKGAPEDFCITLRGQDAAYVPVVAAEVMRALMDLAGLGGVMPLKTAHILPAASMIAGNLRAGDPDLRQRLKDGIDRILEGAVRKYGVEAEVEYRNGCFSAADFFHPGGDERRVLSRPAA
jgi:hypothetical protein